LDPAGAPVIVVDTNVICYRYIPSPHSADVDRLVAKDSDWIVPLLWRSEFRNVLAGALRNKVITVEGATAVMEQAEASFLGREYLVSSRDVLRLVAASQCSAYDCEFVALAQEQGIPLLTADRQILRAFPKLAISLDKFVASRI
jgi:predicted nucleic acid-binding protein